MKKFKFVTVLIISAILISCEPEDLPKDSLDLEQIQKTAESGGTQSTPIDDKKG